MRLLLLVRAAAIAEPVTQTMMAFEQFLHLCAQLVGVERLGEVGVRPCLDAPDALLLRDFRGDDDDGNMVYDLVAAHLPAHL